MEVLDELLSVSIRRPTHITHLSSRCGWAVGPHGQAFSISVCIPVPVPRDRGAHLAGRGRRWRVQRLCAEQRPRAMKLTKVAEGYHSVHLKWKRKLWRTLLHCIFYATCNHLFLLSLPGNSVAARLISTNLTFGTLATSTRCPKLVYAREVITTVPLK